MAIDATGYEYYFRRNHFFHCCTLISVLFFPGYVERCLFSYFFLWFFYEDIPHEQLGRFHVTYLSSGVSSGGERRVESHG